MIRYVMKWKFAMARPGVTLEQVMAAADRLAASGQRPSVRLIREHLGDTGSPNTIQRFLAEWRESRPQGNIAPIEISAALQAALSAEISRAVMAAVEALMARSNSPTLGHPKFPQAGPPDYDDSGATAMRAAASLRR